MNAAKIFNYPAMVFGNFSEVMKDIFNDPKFKEDGVGIVDPPAGFFNSSPFNNNWRENIKINNIGTQQLTAVKIGRKKIGLYHHDTTNNSGDSKTAGQFFDINWELTKSLRDIDDVDEFERCF